MGKAPGAGKKVETLPTTDQLLAVPSSAACHWWDLNVLFSLKGKEEQRLGWGGGKRKGGENGRGKSWVEKGTWKGWGREGMEQKGEGARMWGGGERQIVLPAPENMGVPQPGCRIGL